MFRCIIVDEAHRATKDYSYAQVYYFDQILHNHICYM